MEGGKEEERETQGGRERETGEIIDLNETRRAACMREIQIHRIPHHHWQSEIPGHVSISPTLAVGLCDNCTRTNAQSFDISFHQSRPEQ
jgi:hypothetical protein